MAGAAILNFQKVTFWTPDYTCIALSYKHTKFGANRSRIGQDMPFCVFSKMAATAILNFQFASHLLKATKRSLALTLICVIFHGIFITKLENKCITSERQCNTDRKLP